MKDNICKKLLKEPLTKEETEQLISSFFSDNTSEALIEDYLLATSNRKVSAEELVGGAESLRAHMLKVPHNLEILDTAGTGGSGLSTFNTSTASAFVCAAAGQAVAKHGNRAATSKCGSADIIEALGIRLDLSPEQLSKCLEQTNFCFMFAPKHHASTKRVVIARKKLGVRTIFNFLGPLCNPAGASYQIIGVSDESMLETYANAVVELGIKRALIVRGEDGLDEISLCAKTNVFEVDNGKIKNYSISPEDFGFSIAQPEKIKGESVKESVTVMKKTLSGSKSPIYDLVALNSGAALYISNKASSIADGVKLAKDILDSGKADQKLQEVIAFNKEAS